MTGSAIPVLWPTQIDSTSFNLCNELNEAISDKILRIAQLSYKIATIGQKLLVLLRRCHGSERGFKSWIGSFWSVISQGDADCAKCSLVHTCHCTKAAHFGDWQGSCNCLTRGGSHHSGRCSMADDQIQRGIQDRTPVDVPERYNVESLAQRLGVMPEEIRSAADKVGKSPAKITDYFRNKLT